MRKILIVLSFVLCHVSLSVAQTTEVLLETTAGNIRISLYDETPQTRDNFLKITKMGVYDSLLIHRVIKNFMIQAGDPESKTASDTAMLGGGDVGYTVPAEFLPKKYFHKTIVDF